VPPVDFLTIKLDGDAPPWLTANVEELTGEPIDTELTVAAG
jgi:hypothetical protein